MKQIQKAAEPTDLTEWRIQYSNDPNFGYNLIDSDLRAAIQQALLDEQGRIDAYTEQRIWEDNSHIEHLKAQTHCTPDEEVSYTNMVACYPGPNPESEIPYGAICKGAWPSPKDEALFVSPLSQRCEQRFCYNEDGSVEATSDDDIAAQTTIRQLNLNHKTLRSYRCSAVQGTLGSNYSLSYRDAKVRLRRLKKENGPETTPFYTAIVQALRSYIQRLEYIQQQNS